MIVTVNMKVTDISSDYESDDDMEMELQGLIRDTESTQDVNSSTFLQEVLQALR